MKRNTVPTTASLTRTLCHGVALLAAATLASACAVLPSTDNTSKSNWASYDEAHSAYTSVALAKTTRKELQKLGFTPDNTPNVRILNYVDVGNLFGSAFRPEDLPVGVRQCFDAQDACVGYVVAVRNVKNARNGNVAADLLGFRKHTLTTGFEFQATLVLVDGRVVYKMWNGTPSVERTERQSTPLGPMQSLSGIIPKPGF
ncbi:MAG: hypothetical protein EON60_06220 [Alphaproteobacteria bacterium]|nr:MAG: hypothetical protein EON60_06220 [Alphaproteobacteria bacterium]